MTTGRKHPLYWMSTHYSARLVHIVRLTPKENSLRRKEARTWGYYYCGSPYHPTVRPSQFAAFPVEEDFACREPTEEEFRQKRVCLTCNTKARKAGEFDKRT